MALIEIDKTKIRQRNANHIEDDDAIYLRLSHLDKLALLKLLNAHSSRDSQKAAGLSDDECERVETIIESMYL